MRSIRQSLFVRKIMRVTEEKWERRPKNVSVEELHLVERRVGFCFTLT